MPADDEILTALAGELEKLARRRIVKAFSSHYGQPPLEIPNLCRIAQTLEPTLWKTDQVCALTTTIAAAVEQLKNSGEVIAHTDLRYWELASKAYNLEQENLDHLGGKAYSKLLKSAFELKASHLPEETRRNHTAILRRKLAVALRKLEQDATACETSFDDQCALSVADVTEDNGPRTDGDGTSAAPKQPGVLSANGRKPPVRAIGILMQSRNGNFLLSLLFISGMAVVVVGLLAGIYLGRRQAPPPSPKVVIEMAPQRSGQIATTPPRPKLDNSQGWGPARPTFTDEKPATYPVFNSITDSGWWITGGDERQFLTCWDKDIEGSIRSNELVADDGHTYGCVAYFSNDIAENLDDGNPAAELQNARMSVGLPETSLYNPGITAFLSASNAGEVWASCNFVSPRPMRIIYQFGSARMYTNGTPAAGLRLAEIRRGNSVITDGLVTSSGALLGYDRQDGVVRYGYKYSGWVEFDIRIELDPGLQ